jgi:glycerophosphoryl diester phosphodiesterase
VRNSTPATFGSPPRAGAFLVAHRAGNDLGRLRSAEALGIPLIEADVHLFAGRLEVRHLKTVGPLPILWDRWTLAAPWTPRLLLDELLGTAEPGQLMLDLKTGGRRLPALVASAVAGHEITICSQHWHLLDALDGAPGMRLVYSVGSARRLGDLRRRFSGRQLAGISIHRGLLDPETVRDLRERADLLMSWPVEDAAQARTLSDWGVQGLITSRFDELAGLNLAAPAAAVAA